MKEVDNDILARRARQLALPKKQAQKRDKTMALLTFEVVATRYALSLDDVETVARVDEVLTIPRSPTHIAGIIRRSGRAIALVDLRRFLQPAIRGIADANYAIIVKTRDNKLIALEVEGIEGVIYIDKALLRPPPENLDAIQTPFISAATEDGRCVFDVARFVEVFEATNSRSFTQS
jgi:purine-binding chemotaxis protein CheW